MILFTHNDLDAVGCELCVRKSNLKLDRVFYEDYATFEQTANEIIEYARINSINSLLIADLSFAERPATLQLLLDNFKTVIHLDHHSYPDDFKVTPHFAFKQIIDSSRCGCKICFDVLKLTDPFLKNLIEVIDAQDRWIETSPAFEKSINLNNYFWHVGYQAFLNNFLNNRIPTDYKETIDLIESANTNKIQEMVSTHRLMRNGKVTIQIDPVYIVKLILNEFKLGQIAVIMATGSVIRVRLSQAEFTKEQASAIRNKIVETVTGHPHAFTYKYETHDLKLLFTELKRVSNLISGETRD